MWFKRGMLKPKPIPINSAPNTNINVLDCIKQRYDKPKAKNAIANTFFSLRRLVALGINPAVNTAINDIKANSWPISDSLKFSACKVIGKSTVEVKIWS